MRIIYMLPFIFMFSCASEAESTEDSNTTTDTTSNSITDAEVTPEISEPVDYTDYDDIAFGFSDMKGDTIILVDIPKHLSASDYQNAYSTSGKLELVFLSHQTETGNARGKGTFDVHELEGELYQVKENTTAPPLWENLMFAPNQFTEDRQLLTPIKTDQSIDLSEEQKKQIEGDKQRKISRSAEKGTFEEGSLYFVEFEPKVDSVLVSLIWIGAEKNTYLDFPAKFNEFSTWRVDDGGVFDFDMFSILTVFKSNYGIEILTDWIGFEGSNLTYYLVREGQFESVKDTYFYSGM